MKVRITLDVSVGDPQDLNAAWLKARELHAGAVDGISTVRPGGFITGSKLKIVGRIPKSWGPGLTEMSFGAMR